MSWLEISADSPFSLNNTPFGIISVKGSEQEQRVGATRYGEHVVDLSLLEQEGLLADAFRGSEGEHRRVFNQAGLCSSIAYRSIADLSDLTAAHLEPVCCSASLDSLPSPPGDPEALRRLFFRPSRQRRPPSSRDPSTRRCSGSSTSHHSRLCRLLGLPGSRTRRRSSHFRRRNSPATQLEHASHGLQRPCWNGIG